MHGDRSYRQRSHRQRAYRQGSYRQRPYRHRPHRHSHARRVRRGLLRLLFLALVATVVLGGAGVVSLAGIAVVALADTAAAMFVVMCAVIAGMTVLVRLVRLARAVRPRDWAPLPAPRRPSDWRADWRAARQRFEALCTEYGRYECDPIAVLRLPALADVTVPSTGRFVHAFAEAQALHSEKEPPEQYAATYGRAVEQAWQAWRAASDAAERIRLAGLSPRERTSVQRVIKLLTMAENSGNPAERQAAYAKARSELATLESAGTIHLPAPALATLDTSARAALSSGLSTSATQGLPTVPNGARV